MLVFRGVLCSDPIHEWVPVQFLSSDFCSHPKDMLRQLKDSEQQLWNLHAKQADSVDLWQGHRDTYILAITTCTCIQKCMHTAYMFLIYL